MLAPAPGKVTPIEADEQRAPHCATSSLQRWQRSQLGFAQLQRFAAADVASADQEPAITW